jgi:hypothetical protein
MLTLDTFPVSALFWCQHFYVARAFWCQHFSARAFVVSAFFWCQSLSGVASTHTDEHDQPGECAELRASTSRRKRCIDSTNGPSRRLSPQSMAQRNTARRLCRKFLASQNKIQHRYRHTSNFLRICSALVDSPEPSESSARSIFFLCSSRIACKHFRYSLYIQRAIFGFNTWSKVPFAM